LWHGSILVEKPVLSAPGGVAARGAATAGKGKRVLLAEDDQIVKHLLANMLTRADYQVETAEDGRQAVEMWQGGTYDLVLMDVEMPRMNGFQAAAAIRGYEAERGGYTPIIAMTGHAHRGDAEICLAAGMDAYIAKPIDFLQSLEVISQTLERFSEKPSRRSRPLACDP
jgi:CheY-like chemotaxis protein